MPKYVYVGERPRVLLGLQVGKNASHRPAKGNPALKDGQTVVVAHGDTVTTRKQYRNALLTPAKRRTATGHHTRHADAGDGAQTTHKTQSETTEE